MKLLLDSNTVNYLLRSREPASTQFVRAVEEGHTFFSCDVVEYELRRYLLLKEATRQLQRYEALLQHWMPLSLNRDDWHRAAELWADLHRRGTSIEDRDLLIATAALKVEATLVTSNVRHFAPLNLAVVDWQAEPE